MPINFLYIDDEKTEALSELIAQIEEASEGSIKIHHEQVMESIHAVAAFTSKHGFDGILIDQDLRAVSDNGNKADYFGTTLAQQLRTEIARKEILPLPLILLSYEEIIVDQLEPDDSSKNLFDAVFKKKALRDQEFRTVATKKMIALVDAYRTANQHRKSLGIDLSQQEVKNILQCDDETFNQVDTRFIDFVSSKASDPHALVGAIYSSLVQSAGMLVTEKMLQTKLGVSSASNDWGKCKEHLEQFKYKGPFHQIKDRWWFSRIEDWWFEFSPESVLQSLNCSERVNILRTQFGFDIEPIPIRFPNGEQSQNLWVNCILSGAPIDPYDALRVRDPEAKPWEQPKYIDIVAHLEDDGVPSKYVVHTDDQPKVKRLIVRLKPDVNS